MRFASVVLDISTRALDAPFSYFVPEALAETCLVGATVLVKFANRAAVGYVVGLQREPPQGVPVEKLQPVAQVLAEPAFDEHGAATALWLAREYACPPCEAVRLFLAPGQKVKISRETKDDPWELECIKAGAVDARWAQLTPEANDFEPRRQASRQRQVLAALMAGPQRLTELNATIPGASSVVAALAKKGVLEISSRRVVRGSDETTLSSAAAPRPQSLTQGQIDALAAIDEACEEGNGSTVLVDGVTGSGKTEVYLSAIEHVLARGKGAIVLVPEISLTAQTVGRFRSRFGENVAVLHSRLSVGERYDQWDIVRQGRARVVIGARSALFAPVADLGLIVIDEEHEASYKQGSSPRYHAREVAAHMAAEHGCALVLGSATPSLESLVRCSQGSFRGARWRRIEMLVRPGSAQMPAVEAVDMAEQFRGGGRSVFSGPLLKALQETCARDEKAVLLLNRRGFANFLMCRECGCVPECPHCSSSLTYHERGHMLACHTCGRSWPQRAFPDPSTRCPNCGSRYLAAFGVGTQRVEDELRSLLPAEVKIIRMDADTTKAKGAHQRLLEEFDAAPSAVLVGTQMIAKGLDFPEVTLVGVINADTMLKLPDFRAAERTFDLLEQVAGRAGRGDAAGKVIIQSYWASHPAIQAVVRHDRTLFLGSELEARSESNYPPFSRVANVTLWGASLDAVRRASTCIAQALRSEIGDADGWEVLGPADCVKAKAQDRYRRHVVVKAPPDADLGDLLSRSVASIGSAKGITISVDIDAYDMM